MNVMTFYALCATSGLAFVATVFMILYYDVGKLLREMKFARSNEIGKQKDKNKSNEENFGTALIHGADTSLLLAIEEEDESDEERDSSVHENKIKISMPYNESSKEETEVSTELISLKTTGGTKYLTGILEDDENMPESIMPQRSVRMAGTGPETDRIVSILKTEEGRRPNVLNLGPKKKATERISAIKASSKTEKLLDTFLKSKLESTEQTEQLFEVFLQSDAPEICSQAKRKDEELHTLPNISSQSIREKESNNAETAKVYEPCESVSENAREIDESGFVMVKNKLEIHSTESKRGTGILEHDLSTEILEDKLEVRKTEILESSTELNDREILDFNIDFSLDSDSSEITEFEELPESLDFYEPNQEVGTEILEDDGRLDDKGTQILYSESETEYTQSLDEINESYTEIIEEIGIRENTEVLNTLETA